MNLGASHFGGIHSSISIGQKDGYMAIKEMSRSDLTGVKCNVAPESGM